MQRAGGDVQHPGRVLIVHGHISDDHEVGGADGGLQRRVGLTVGRRAAIAEDAHAIAGRPRVERAVGADRGRDQRRADHVDGRVVGAECRPCAVLEPVHRGEHARLQPLGDRPERPVVVHVDVDDVGREGARGRDGVRSDDVLTGLRSSRKAEQTDRPVACPRGAVGPDHDARQGTRPGDPVERRRLAGREEGVDERGGRCEEATGRARERRDGVVDEQLPVVGPGGGPPVEVAGTIHAPADVHRPVERGDAQCRPLESGLAGPGPRCLEVVGVAGGREHPAVGGDPQPGGARGEGGFQHIVDRRSGLLVREAGVGVQDPFPGGVEHHHAEVGRHVQDVASHDDAADASCGVLVGAADLEEGPSLQRLGVEALQDAVTIADPERSPRVVDRYGADRTAAEPRRRRGGPQFARGRVVEEDPAVAGGPEPVRRRCDGRHLGERRVGLPAEGGLCPAGDGEQADDGERERDPHGTREWVA